MASIQKRVTKEGRITYRALVRIKGCPTRPATFDRCSDITDFRFHDLRHSTASYLAMSGATLLEIADILGHKTLQMVKRYSHLSEDHKATVLKKNE